MRTHQLVLAHVEAELAAGRLTLGGRLPGERVLAEQLGISRPSVREAIRALEVLGVVRTATGSGPEAGAVIVADPAAGLGVALRLHVATSGVAVGDVVQLRLLLETWAVREAAGKPDATVLADAAVLLDRMDAEPDPDRFLDLDGDFHAGLVGLAGNVLVTAVMTSVRGAVRSYVGAGATRLPDWTATSRRLRAEHRRILDAVREGRADDAEREVRAHITGYYRDSGYRLSAARRAHGEQSCGLRSAQPAHVTIKSCTSAGLRGSGRSPSPRLPNGRLRTAPSGFPACKDGPLHGVISRTTRASARTRQCSRRKRSDLFLHVDADVERVAHSESPRSTLSWLHDTAPGGRSPVRSRRSASRMIARYRSWPVAVVTHAVRRQASRVSRTSVRSSSRVARAMTSRHWRSNSAMSSGVRAART